LFRSSADMSDREEVSSFLFLVSGIVVGSEDNYP
jgi:hypothetical protein